MRFMQEVVIQFKYLIFAKVQSICKKLFYHLNTAQINVKKLTLILHCIKNLVLGQLVIMVALFNLEISKEMSYNSKHLKEQNHMIALNSLKPRRF